MVSFYPVFVSNLGLAACVYGILGLYHCNWGSNVDDFFPPFFTATCFLHTCIISIFPTHLQIIILNSEVPVYMQSKDIVYSCLNREPLIIADMLCTSCTTSS